MLGWGERNVGLTAAAAVVASVLYEVKQIERDIVGMEPFHLPSGGIL